MTNNLTVDIDVNCAELKISRDIYLRILKAAVKQTRQDLDVMQNAFAQNDVDTLQSLSHRLKGDYANLRISDLSGLARDINLEARAGKDLERMRGLFDEFKKLFESLCLLTGDAV